MACDLECLSLVLHAKIESGVARHAERGTIQEPRTMQPNDGRPTSELLDVATGSKALFDLDEGDEPCTGERFDCTHDAPAGPDLANSALIAAQSISEPFEHASLRLHTNVRYVAALEATGDDPRGNNGFDPQCSKPRPEVLDVAHDPVRIRVKGPSGADEGDTHGFKNPPRRASGP